MLFRKKITKRMAISITDPCSESWSGMKVVDDVQRHCSSCVKNVVDFTQMSEDEIVSFFSNTKENICGRFRPEQLNKVYAPLPEISRPANWWKAAMLLPLTFFAKNTSAQQNDSIRANDSLVASNDSLPESIELPADSSVVEVDSSSLPGDSLKEVVEVRSEEAPQEIIWTTAVAGGATITIGWSVPEYYLTGDVSVTTPTPTQLSVGCIYNPIPEPSLPPGVLPDGWSFWQWQKKHKMDYSKTIPALITRTDPSQKKSDPVPPTLPRRPWYEAILPPSLRPRRND